VSQIPVTPRGAVRASPAPLRSSGIPALSPDPARVRALYPGPVFLTRRVGVS
jgi:hypothetical protein